MGTVTIAFLQVMKLRQGRSSALSKGSGNGRGVDSRQPGPAVVPSTHCLLGKALGVLASSPVLSL